MLHELILKKSHTVFIKLIDEYDIFVCKHFLTVMNIFSILNILKRIFNDIEFKVPENYWTLID